MIGGPGSDGAYFLACDVCGETADAIFREFNIGSLIKISFTRGSCTLSTDIPARKE